MQYLESKYALSAWQRGRNLDYGCGKGLDAQIYGMEKYDPHYYPDSQHLEFSAFDLITCNYVLNVIEKESDRIGIMARIYGLLADGGVAYISVRDDRANLKGHTKRGTWQGHITLDLPVERHEKGSFIMYRMEKLAQNK
jgi:hypothetical protein